MVYAPQRRHAVSSITLILHTTAFMQYLYSPNFLVLLSRALIQQQIIVAPSVHPTRSLFGMAFMLTMMNSVAVLLHWLDFLAGLNGSKGVILDFVGQSVSATMTWILVLDLLLYLGQMVTLVLAFVTGHAGSIPSSASFPYADVLLPPAQSPYQPVKASDEDVHDDDDIESGLKQRRRRGFESAFEELDTDERALWLNDEDGPSGPTGTSPSGRLSSSSTADGRTREPPLVFSLTLPYIFHLVFSLPNPTPPAQAFAGGTPSPTPPVTPGVETTSPMLRRSILTPVDESDADSPRARGEPTVTADEEDTSRSMPGEFRRNDRNLGEGE